MFLKLPIMLWSNTPKFRQLRSNYVCSINQHHAAYINFVFLLYFNYKYYLFKDISSFNNLPIQHEISCIKGIIILVTHNKLSRGAS